MHDLYAQKRQIFGGFIVTETITAADTTRAISLPALKSVLHKLFVQRIRWMVTTGNAGKTLVLSGASGAPVLSGAIPGDTAGTSGTLDFGAKGSQLVVNELLKATISAAGAAYVLSIEGYSRT